MEFHHTSSREPALSLPLVFTPGFKRERIGPYKASGR